LSFLDMLLGGGRAGGPEAVARAKELVAQGAVLVDVRTDGEFARGHVPGAICIPVGDLQRRAGELPKGAKVVLYCASGARSASAARFLSARGHEVLDLGPMPHRW
jgi:rhodanese-related sulfurtransferase